MNTAARYRRMWTRQLNSEAQIKADIAERLTLAFFVLRSKERSLGLKSVQTLKDTSDTLSRLRSPEIRLNSDPRCSFCGQVYHYLHYCVTEAEAVS